MYHRLPSGPETMLPGNALAVGSANSVMTPSGVILATLLVPVLDSVNHMLPSGPSVIANGPALAVGTGYSTIVPLGGRTAPIRKGGLLEPPLHAASAATSAMTTNFRIVDTPSPIRYYATIEAGAPASAHIFLDQRRVRRGLTLLRCRKGLAPMVRRPKRC